MTFCIFGQIRQNLGKWQVCWENTIHLFAFRKIGDFPYNKFIKMRYFLSTTNFLNNDKRLT